MTKEQAKDIETIRYFIPNDMKSIPITDQDIQDFLALSERGENKDRVKDREMDGFNALVQGKRWRGIHMQMYEDTMVQDAKDMMDARGQEGAKYMVGTMPYSTILEDVPEAVAEFMAKEMFKGADRELIMKTFHELNK